MQATMKLPHVVFLVGLSKSRGLFHVLPLFLGKDAIKESRFYIVLLKAPVIDRGNVEDSAQGF